MNLEKIFESVLREGTFGRTSALTFAYSDRQDMSVLMLDLDSQPRAEYYEIFGKEAYDEVKDLLDQKRIKYVPANTQDRVVIGKVGTGIRLNDDESFVVPITPENEEIVSKIFSMVSIEVEHRSRGGFTRMSPKK